MKTRARKHLHLAAYLAALIAFTAAHDDVARACEHTLASGQLISDDLVASFDPNSHADLQANVIGTRRAFGSLRYINILCRYPGDASEPFPPEFVDQQLMSSDYPGIIDYWNEVSQGTFNITTTTVGWIEMAAVAPGSPFEDNPLSFPSIFARCTQAVDDLIDFSDVYAVNLLLNDGPIPGGFLAWAGAAQATLDGISAFWPWTMMNPAAWSQHATVAHEMGHTLGLPHADAQQTNLPYDNPFAVMSCSTCSTVIDPVIGPLAVHPIGYHKQLLGVLPWRNNCAVASEQAPQIATYQLVRSALPPAEGCRQIRIISPDTRMFTVEVRQHVGYDAGLISEGVVIHEIEPTRLAPALLMEDNPGSDRFDSGKVWTVGETYAHPTLGFFVSVDAATSDGYQLSIRGAALLPIIQSSKQARCITRMNADAGRLAKTQTRELIGCIDAMAKERIDSAQLCAVDDSRNKVSKAIARLDASEAKRCVRDPPDFGFAGATAAASAIIVHNSALIGDILGSDLDAAIAQAPTGDDARRCRSTVLTALGRLTDRRIKTFSRCKKAGLKQGTIGSSDLLGACLQAVDADRKGKIAEARATLGAALTTTCASFDLADVFTGPCALELAPLSCIDQRSACRTCRMLRGVDALDMDCDLFDDGSANLTCPLD